jgi:hypothetical protein
MCAGQELEPTPADGYQSLVEDDAECKDFISVFDKAAGPLYALPTHVLTQGHVLCAIELAPRKFPSCLYCCVPFLFNNTLQHLSAGSSFIALVCL